MNFDNVVTIILRLQRKLEEKKNYLFKNSCLEEISPPIPSPSWRSGAPPERSYPTAKERLLRRRRKAERSYSKFKVRRGGHEKIPLVQGKEQP